MARRREARMLRSRHDKETGRAKRREDLARGAEQWPDLFRDLLRQDPDEDLVDRLENHWLPDINQGETAHALPEEALLYLKVWALETLAEEKAHEAMEGDGELRNLSRRMRAIEEEHGLERGEPWLPGEGPGNWEELRRQWQQKVDGIFLETLEEHGEQELARMFREDPEALERRTEEGRRYIFGQ
ncbi:hypothetical protein [Thiohalorhabdus denitrificans]|uniref:Uncharacterized protein n=1 Tax=Thiohalorhabdus denitrificans TaxID=381306 RepID=A0A1G5HFJ8_9GAMM|nr:hypothetical protein [Thiohalorhabdus denitrificans]SCY62504.1 hypothetical protein SAMN05661077_2740 [Thiohalorhabdus denitrificans]